MNDALTTHTPPDALINVLLIGGGGREHALALKLKASPRLGQLWITHPENPGLAALGKPVTCPVSAREIYRLVQFCDHQSVGLVVIGPEEPLAEGFVDKLSTPYRLVFGPNAEAAKLEADKGWAKQLMRSAAIPTGESRVFGDAESAMAYFESRVEAGPALVTLMEESSRYTDRAERRQFIVQRCREDKPVFDAYSAPRMNLPVIKAAGLAKGKGVVLPRTLAEAYKALDEILVRRIFGDAGRQVVVEERLTGPEVSVLAIVDGRSILVLPPCQDHKRLGDGDTGPNTGGMGAFCPSRVLDETMMSRVEREILVPTIDALRRDGIEFKGVLYAGIMLTHAGPKVLEFNVRFGDPECQPLMARLKSDIIELMLASCRGTLDEIEVEWDPSEACCIVLAAHGYPEKPRAGDVVTGIDQASRCPGVVVAHAGTRRMPNGDIVTAGGRVLSVTALGTTLADARERAYAAADLINFRGKQVRRDIGLPQEVKPKKVASTR